MVNKRMRNVFLIVVSAVPFAIIRNVFLGRELSEANMGLMSLLITIVSFVAPISLLGQHNALVRFISKDNNLYQYNWKKYNQKILLISSSLAVVSSVVFWIIYQFHFSIIFYLIIAITATVTGDLFKEVKRAQGYYEISILFQRSIRYIFPIFLLILYLSNSFKLNLILISFGVIYIVYGISFIAYILATTPVGNKNIPRFVHKDGAFFWGLDISLIIIASIDKLFIAKLTSLEELAIYFTTFTIMQIYNLAYQSIEFVLLPYSNKMGSIKLKRLLTPIISAAVLITVFYLLIGPELLKILYKGKYNEGIHLIPWFCAAGFIRLLNVIPSSLIGGRLKQKALKTLFYSNTTILVLNIILGFLLTYHFRLIGALIATIIVWSARTVAGYIILYHFKD